MKDIFATKKRMFKIKFYPSSKNFTQACPWQIPGLCNGSPFQSNPFTVCQHGGSCYPTPVNIHRKHKTWYDSLLNWMSATIYPHNHSSPLKHNRNSARLGNLVYLNHGLTLKVNNVFSAPCIEKIDQNATYSSDLVTTVFSFFPFLKPNGKTQWFSNLIILFFMAVSCTLVHFQSIGPLGRCFL